MLVITSKYEVHLTLCLTCFADSLGASEIDQMELA